MRGVRRQSKQVHPSNMSKIESSGCGRRRVLGRGICVGILVLLAVLLMVGGTKADIAYVDNMTYVYTDYPNDVHGGSTKCYYGSSGHNSRCYVELPFNYSIVYLNIYVRVFNAGATFFEIYNTNYFNEDSLTWNNQPGLGSFIMNVSYVGEGWYNVSLLNPNKYIIISKEIVEDGDLYLWTDDKSGYIPYIIYTPPSSASFDPSGYVNDSLGNPLTGVNVTISNATASASNTSNVLGFWNLSGQLSDGLYNYSAQKTGYTTTTGSETFTNGGTTLVNITLTVSTVTISCPVGWCYVASNYSSKTLLELDNLFSTDTVQGRYNATSQKYESHRTGYSFNQNITVAQKEGYYYYFTSATDITTTPGSTPSITLKTNWNLVANYGTTNRTLSDLKTSIGANATQAQYYNRTTKTWISTGTQSVPAMESFMAYVNQTTVWVN